MKNKNLSWVGALFVFALLLWCTAVTPGKVADPATYTCAVYSTFFSLLPPVIAIVLALNTKEVYTSLLVGIASGALLYANGNLELALNTLFFNEDGGMITKLSDSGNVGILAFLVMLGILVALMNKAGGSAAFGRWASTHIHSRAGAQFATLLLGVMIFVDDYFNCLTVGSVMRPVTDRQKVSRAKLAYLIDSTAAPICIIAPVSSWAAAVTSSVPARAARSPACLHGICRIGAVSFSRASVGISPRPPRNMVKPLMPEPAGTLEVTAAAQLDTGAMMQMGAAVESIR